MNTPEGWKHCDKCDTRVDCCLRGCAALAAAPTPPEQPAAHGELSDEQIDDCMPLGIAPYSTLVGQAEIRRFARAVIAADRAARKRPEAEVAEPPCALASSMRSPGGGPRFRPVDGHQAIDDDDFIFDAVIKVSGDFTPPQRQAYVQWIADALNAADERLVRGEKA